MLMLSTSSSLQLKPYRSPSAFTAIGESFRKNLLVQCFSTPNLREQKGHQLQYEENFKRRRLLIFLVSVGLFPTLPSFGKTKVKSPFDEKRIAEQNKRIQRENNAPEDFPSFIREGFEVKVVAPDNYVRSESGLIFKDFEVGKGDHPKDGQQVIFHYIGYNESGRRIDSTYIQGAPAKVRLGTNGLVPGFEQGIIDMRPGGKGGSLFLQNLDRLLDLPPFSAQNNLKF